MTSEQYNYMMYSVATELRVPVSLLLPREPKTPEEQKSHDEFVAFTAKRVRASRKALVLDLTAHIQAAAVKCDTYHVFADYAPHVDTLSVVVRSKQTNYQAPFAEWPDVLLSEYVRLSDEEAAEQLVAIVEQLREMGINA